MGGIKTLGKCYAMLTACIQVVGEKVETREEEVKLQVSPGAWGFAHMVR
jgi:hypothetical protein